MEEMKNKGFYKEVNKTFAGWEPAPPVGAWDKIEARLDEDKRRPVLWWWLGGIALLLTLAGGAYLVSNSSSNNPEKNAISNTANSPKNQNVAIQPKQDSEVKKLKPVNSIIAAKSSSNYTKPLVVVNKNIANTYKSTVGPTTIHTASKPKIIIANAAKKDIATNLNGTESVKNVASQNSHPKENAGDKNNNLNANSNLKISNSSVSSNAANPVQTNTGNAEIDSSFTVTKKLKPSSTELRNIKSDSIPNNKQAADVKPKIVQADSTIVKRDSIVPVKVVAADSIKKPVITQTKDSIKPILPKISIFSISAFAGPEQAGQVIMQNNSAFNVGGETSKLHFIYGLRGSISINKKLEVSLAFSYSSVAVNFPSTQVYFSRYITQPFVFNSSYGDMSVPASTMLQGFSPLAPPAITSFKLNYQYAQTIQFMNVPVCIRLNLGKGKLKPYVTAGANIQYALTANSELDLLKENETDVLNYANINVRKLNIAPTASVGLEYDATRHIGFFLEPNARYNLLPSSTGSTIKSGSFFVGCLGGLRLNL